MLLRLYHIIPPLQPYIKVICSMENDAAGATLPPFRVLPDTCTELFISYSNESSTYIAGKKLAGEGSSFLVSRMNRYMDVHQPGKTGFLSACFFPAAARHFFNLPMDELSNSVTDLQELWKGLASEMTDRILSASDNQQRVTILQQYLLRLLQQHERPDKTLEHCLWQMHLQKGQLGIKELASGTGISNRQLARRFNDKVGLSPKEFARVTRFISSLETLKKYPSLSLTSIAYETGYYDQAQFIHDCKEFSGYSPGRLLAAPHTLY